MDKMATFRDVESTFTRHIRDPEHVPAPDDVEDRRMGIYRRLLYRNIEGFMADCYPVLRQILSDDQWHALIRDYFLHHKARTPLFPKMPSEFLQYLEKERTPKDDDYPFMHELAHYEWMEMAVNMDGREIDTGGIDREGDLLDGVPVLSPLAWPLAYRFPVHRIGPDFLPSEAPEQQTYIIVYRDLDDNVGFLELNPVSAKLVEYIAADSGRSGRELLLAVAEEIRHPEPGVVINGGLEIMESMRGKDIILGTRRSA
ncbi:MAG: putative DNA-binding domain-containing protein [Gammaproteobacteria bacterium]